ncbi:ATP-dependent DNA helicase RecG [bacterium]|nr:ATP-dependent DNA helicase RecG [bacterium]
MSEKKVPLDLSIRFVRQVGNRSEAFEKAGVLTLRDLLYYTPRRYIDRTTASPIGQLTGNEDREVTVIGTIADAREIRMKKGKSRYEAILDDPTGTMKLIWFRRTNQIKKWIKPGLTAAFSGKVNAFRFQLQMAHPDLTYLSKGEVEDLQAGKGKMIALYPGGADFEKVGLDARKLRTLMDRVIGEYLPQIQDFWPQEWLDKLGVVNLREAFEAVHRPRSIEQYRKGMERLKMDELMMLQLLWAWTRKYNRRKAKGIAYKQVGETTRDLIEKELPFELTAAQKRVMREIWTDMRQQEPMSRLLQGDVGSGKTVIALIAMTIAVENGYQAALMVPTEILAEQHYLTSRRFLEDLGVPVVLLTGSAKAAERRERLAQISSGRPSIIIGTHALIQDAVQMKNLGIAVIDEQHRFGVAQRLKLMDPGTDRRPDVLVMTATPIPRSLAISMYGDLEVSRLDEMPPGRGTIKTIAVNGAKDRDNLYRDIRKRVEQGGRAYVVFPLVAESEKLDLAAAEEGREELMQGALKGLKVGLLHGRMKVEEKAAAMQAFASGETPVLVSTTVIEVGVDVPEATEMVVEHAERFGLAQLHQLRGRVGRGGRDSRCYLVAYPPVGEVARARIKCLVHTLDGFLVAEEDLRIRGAGDMFGVKQSGMPPMRFADIVEDQGLLLKAKKLADDLINTDPLMKALPTVKKEFERVALRKVEWLEVG